MTVKLTKTEQRILDYMHRRYGHYGAVRSTGNGPEGGRRSGGIREFDACMSLVRKGLAEQVGDIHRHIVYNRGWGEHCSEIMIKLPGTNLR